LGIPFEEHKYMEHSYHLYKVYQLIYNGVFRERLKIFSIMKNFEVKELLTGLPIVNYHAAGIDVGNKEMWVTYTNPEGCKCQFKSECFTKDLDEIVHIFLKERVTDVAMESTGVYGGPLREKLETAGLRVTIINPRDYKRSGDKKDDAYDSMQIHLYHSIDFFRRSHFAPEHWRDLREYNHERDIVALQKATTLVRIQRLLTMMNVKFANVVSDIEGVGAMKVITAIAEGETDAEKLVALLNLKLFKKSSKEEITESLKGNYRSCWVYVLKEKLEEYKFFVSQMRKYETRIEHILEEISILEETKRIADEKGTQISEDPENPEEKNVQTSENKQKKKTKKTNSKRTTKARKNEYDFNGDYYLCRILGIDLTAVEGFSDKTLLTILSVTGTDMSQ
jgi:hypothetical protein